MPLDQMLVNKMTVDRMPLCQMLLDITPVNSL